MSPPTPAADRAWSFLWTVGSSCFIGSVGSMAGLWIIALVLVAFDPHDAHAKVMFPQIAAGCGIVFGGMIGAVVGVIRFILAKSPEATCEDKQDKPS